MVEINFFRHAPNARDLAAGEILFEEGAPGDVMYAILEGQIELTMAGRVVGRASDGEIVGEMALVDKSPRSATATAATQTRVVPVDRRSFTFLVQEHPTFAFLVMETMAERLRSSNGTMIADTGAANG